MEEFTINHLRKEISILFEGKSKNPKEKENE
jgi:hypothetical protein